MAEQLILLECINRGDNRHITVGKIYILLEEKKAYGDTKIYSIINDRKREEAYFNSRFNKFEDKTGLGKLLYEGSKTISG